MPHSVASSPQVVPFSSDRLEMLFSQTTGLVSRFSQGMQGLCKALQTEAQASSPLNTSVGCNRFQSQDLSCVGAEISKPFSSSSLPPSLASRHLATSFIPRASSAAGSPSFLRQATGPANSHATDLLPWLRQLGAPQFPEALHPNARRVAVVGSGIAGLSAAWALSSQARVTLFEANDYFGGHTHTVDVDLQGQRHGVDTGFLVFNERTYPLLIQLFEQLGVEVAASDMSFSVQAPGSDLEWSGSNLNTVFAQRSNLLRPDFWRMLADLQRFNRLCTELANSGQERALAQPIGDFLAEQRFSHAFRDWYLLPMVACIWSCPTAQMMSFPISTLIRFCHNHGLLQVTDRPQWFTVRGGARHYVEKLLPRIADPRLNCPVYRVERHNTGGVSVHSAAGTEAFDAVVMASHSDQTLHLLDHCSPLERQVLGAISYQRNRAVLHTDSSLLPQRPRAWAAWNYEHSGRAAGAEQGAVCLHYLLNRLQPLPWQEPVLVSLNPVREPKAELVQGEFDYAHPVFDRAAVAAQARVAQMQGEGQVWFCGAWTRYGFHEDGLLSGLGAARAMLAQWAARPA